MARADEAEVGVRPGAQGGAVDAEPARDRLSELEPAQRVGAGEMERSAHAGERPIAAQRDDSRGDVVDQRGAAHLVREEHRRSRVLERASYRLHRSSRVVRVGCVQQRGAHEHRPRIELRHDPFGVGLRRAVRVHRRG